MATDNPRVAAYLPQRIYERLVEFKGSRGLKSDSAAIIAILENYFFSSTLSDEGDTLTTKERLDDLEIKLVGCVSEIAFLKQAYQGLQLDLQTQPLQPPDTEVQVSEPEQNTCLALSEPLVDYNQPFAEPHTSTDESNEFSLHPSSSQSEPIKVSSIESPICSEIITSELPESDTGLLIISEPISDSLDELPLLKENNHPTVPSVNSELLNDLQSSPLTLSENQNPLKVPHTLNGAALARRLNVSPSTLRHKKNARNFGKWTSEHDPDGIAWYFDGQKFIVHTATDIR